MHQVVKNQAAYYHQARVEIGVLQFLNTKADPGDRHHIVRLKVGGGRLWWAIEGVMACVPRLAGSVLHPIWDCGHGGCCLLSGLGSTA